MRLSFQWPSSPPPNKISVQGNQRKRIIQYLPWGFLTCFNSGHGHTPTRREEKMRRVREARSSFTSIRVWRWDNKAPTGSLMSSMCSSDELMRVRVLGGVLWLAERIPLYQSNHLAQDEEPTSLPLPLICLGGMMARVSLGLHKQWNSLGLFFFISFLIGPPALCSQSGTSLRWLQMALNWSGRNGSFVHSLMMARGRAGQRKAWGIGGSDVYLQRLAHSHAKACELVWKD